MSDKNYLAADALAGEVVLITGATRGIGRAVAEQVVRCGATVIGTATRAEGALEISQRIAQLGARGRGLVLDVTEVAQAEAVVEQVTREFGAVSVLVNNAGITRDTLAVRMKDEDFAVVIDTNLAAVFRLSRAVLRSMMRAKHGRIINVTSVVASIGNPGQANYAAAKAGVEGMTRALAREVGSRGITVNCIAPGFIDTDMTRALPPAQAQALLAQIPVGRLGAVAEIAAYVAFLASPAAAYVTGATVHVNGGMYMA